MEDFDLGRQWRQAWFGFFWRNDAETARLYGAAYIELRGQGRSEGFHASSPSIFCPIRSACGWPCWSCSIVLSGTPSRW